MELEEVLNCNIIYYLAIGILVIFAVIICLQCVWIDHSTITITIKEKYATNNQLYAVSQNGVIYCVRLNIDYAKLNEGKTYEVAVAHNPFIGVGCVNPDGLWNIDKVIREVD